MDIYIVSGCIRIINYGNNLINEKKFPKVVIRRNTDEYIILNPRYITQTEIRYEKYLVFGNVILMMDNCEIIHSSKMVQEYRYKTPIDFVEALCSVKIKESDIEISKNDSRITFQNIMKIVKKN